MLDRYKDASGETRQVFADPTGRRVRFAIGAIILSIIFAIAWLGDYANRVYHLAPLAGNDRSTAGADVVSLGDQDTTDVVLKETWETDCGQGIFGSFRDKTGVSGFVPYGDPTALSALRAHCNQLDSVFYQAFTLDIPDGTIRPLGENSGDFPLADFAAGWKSRNRPAAFPVLTPTAGVATPALMDMFDTRGPGRFYSDLETLPIDNVDGGLCLDLSGHSGIAAADLMPVIRAMRDKLAPAGLQTCLIGRAGADFWEDRTLTRIIGRSVVLGFRAPTAPSEPVAPQGWLDANLNLVRDQIPPDQLSVGLATFGEAWASGVGLPDRVTFAEAMLRANLNGGEIGFNADPGNTVIRYLDKNRRINQIWLSDAAAFHNARQVVPEAPVILWPIGYEDPAIWPLLLPTDTGGDARATIETPVTFDTHAIVEGKGPFPSTILSAVSGERQIRMSSGRVVSQTYDSIPRPHLIGFSGDEEDYARLALTFQGLGSPRAIPDLIATLAAWDLKATFFLSTKELLDHRETVHRLIDAGHLIGTQTIPRPSQGQIARTINRLTNNIAQHYLAHEFGHRAVFVQIPVREDGMPGDRPVLDQLRRLQEQGYLSVYASLEATFDSFDPDTLMEQVRDTATLQPANVLRFVLYDDGNQSGIDRLPEFLDALTRAGFQLESLDQMAGLSPQDALPDALPERAVLDEITYLAMGVGWVGLENAIFLLALIVAARAPVYLALALMRREKYPYDENYTPHVTVVVPAFNEALTIVPTIDSILESNYPNFDVVVIDDGSTDKTAQMVVNHFLEDPRVTLWSGANHGKWFAENLAMGASNSPIYVIVDADTLLDPDAIGQLVQPFKDENVGAVAGTVEIGNRDNFLTDCQVIEYTHTQQLIRRAYEVFNGIIVVPGAIGAWRASAVEAAGGVPGDTVTEDADLTVAVHRVGFRVAYQPAARSYTEAPNSIRAFMRQRLRWSFGMFQVSWKQKRAVLEGLPVGYITMVDSIWYSLVSSLVYPFFDIILLSSAAYWGHSFLTEGAAGLSSFPVKAFIAVMILWLLGFTNILVSFLFARRFEIKLLLMVPLLRFGYRQMIYISSIRAIISALIGRLSGWHKIVRTGTATMRR